MKKLEEMNLVDDFLVYSLTSHKIYGEEAARYILECILQRSIRHLTVMPQKAWYGENPERHGVRLDVYLDEEDGELFDIEPDKNNSSGDVKALPRRARFYHSKIDAGILTAGENYGALRNVVVVFITTYDPFGLNRMVHTIKNSCMEVIADNAQTDGLKRLHEMVTKVKTDKEVGLAYMKMWESEESIRAKAAAEAKAIEKANEILRLLEKNSTVSEEQRKHILEERDLRILDNWYNDAIAKNERHLVAKAKREAIFLLLDDFGHMPETLKATILSETNPETLDNWLKAAKRAESMEQFASSI